MYQPTPEGFVDKFEENLLIEKHRFKSLERFKDYLNFREENIIDVSEKGCLSIITEDKNGKKYQYFVRSFKYQPKKGEWEKPKGEKAHFQRWYNNLNRKIIVKT